MKRGLFKKILCGLLTAALILDYAPVKAAAVEDTGLCPHHSVHTEECGYAPGETGSPCNHQHTEECYREERSCIHVHGDCGYVPGIEGVECDCAAEENGQVVHQEGCGHVEAVPEVPCNHVCSEESGCVQRILDCGHVHDGNCGYAEAKEEAPCGFVCAECEESAVQKLVTPELRDIQFSKYSIPSEQQVMITIRTTENIRHALLEISTVDETLVEHIIQTDLEQGEWRADVGSMLTGEIIFSNRSQAGEYSVRRVLLYDEEDNIYAYAREPQSEEQPLPENIANQRIDVTSEKNPAFENDKTPPTLRDIQLQYDAENHLLSITVDAPDEESGAASANLTFGSQLIGRDVFVDVYADYWDETSGTMKPYSDGLLHGSTLVDGELPSGIYCLENLYVEDRMGNGAYYGANGFPAKLRTLYFRVGESQRCDAYGHVFFDGNVCLKCGAIGGNYCGGIWTLENGVFSLRGTDGVCMNDSADQTPWADFADQIFEAQLENVAGIEPYMFSGFHNLAKVTIPGTRAIYGMAFADCENLKQIYFSGVIPWEISDTAFQNVVADAYYWLKHNYSSEEKENYGGSLTWIPQGSQVKKIQLYVDDSFTPYLQTDRTHYIYVSPIPSDSLMDLEVSLDKQSVIQIEEISSTRLIYRTIGAGTVTLTVSDRKTGCTASVEIVVRGNGISDISCPYEEAIYAGDYESAKRYSFTPERSGYYIGIVTNLSQPGWDGYGFSVTEGEDYIEDVELVWTDQIIRRVFYLVKGKQYTIDVGGTDHVDYGKDGTFQWMYADQTVESVEIEEEEIVCYPGQHIRVSAQCMPSNAYTPIQWSSNTDIFSFSNGNNGDCVVIAEGSGRAILTATCNGRSDSVLVNVRTPKALRLNTPMNVSPDAVNNSTQLVFRAPSDGKYAFHMEGALSGSFQNRGWENHAQGEGNETLFLTLKSGEQVTLNLYFTVGETVRNGIVTVEKAVQKPTEVSITFHGECNGNAQFEADFTPWNSFDEIHEWTVSEPDVLYPVSTVGTFVSFSVLKAGKVTVTAISESGLTASYTLEVGKNKDGHIYQATQVIAPTCTKEGFTVFECKNCDSRYIANPTPALTHNFGDWHTVTAPTPTAPGVQKRVCARCGAEENREIPYSGNVLDLNGTELEGKAVVWLDGAPYPVEQGRVALSEKIPETLVCYSYNTSSGDAHGRYPTGMRVYRVIQTESGIAAQHIPELDNLLQYSGSSIRIAGNKGIRMITSIRQDTRNALTGNGLAGYRLLEYGTLLAQTGKLGDAPLVLNGANVRSNYAFKKGVADPIFKYADGLIQYTNVLVGFDDSQCAEDIAMRPYVKLMDENGQELTIYGGTVYRSIGYIAYQNRNAFPVGSGAYHYVWSIIHNVYGTRYDGDYKG